MTAKKTTLKSSEKSKKSFAVKKGIVAAILTLSLFLNAVLIWAAIGARTGDLDYAIVNKGVEVMCSDSFRDRVAGENEPGQQLALLDYQCQRNENAEKYFKEGYNKYLESQGVPRP